MFREPDGTIPGRSRGRADAPGKENPRRSSGSHHSRSPGAQLAGRDLHDSLGPAGGRQRRVGVGQVHPGGKDPLPQLAAPGGPFHRDPGNLRRPRGGRVRPGDDPGGPATHRANAPSQSSHLHGGPGPPPETAGPGSRSRGPGFVHPVFLLQRSRGTVRIVPGRRLRANRDAVPGGRDRSLSPVQRPEVQGRHPGDSGSRPVHRGHPRMHRPGGPGSVRGCGAPGAGPAAGGGHRPRVPSTGTAPEQPVRGGSSTPEAHSLPGFQRSLEPIQENTQALPPG